MYLYVFCYQHEIQNFLFHHFSLKLALSCWIVFLHSRYESTVF